MLVALTTLHCSHILVHAQNSNTVWHGPDAEILRFVSDPAVSKLLRPTLETIKAVLGVSDLGYLHQGILSLFSDRNETECLHDESAPLCSPPC